MDAFTEEMMNMLLKEREELLKGISNLRTRIDNIDTIMHSRKEGEKAK